MGNATCNLEGKKENEVRFAQKFERHMLIKTNKLLVAATLLTFLTSTTAFSRLGESPQETQARYGPGKEYGSRSQTTFSIRYSAKGFEIDVHFLDGKSAAEQFKKHSGGRWSDKEITDFLGGSFSLDGEWTYSPRERLWYRGNKMTVAYREPGHDDWFWLVDRERWHGKGPSIPMENLPVEAAPAPIAPEIQQAASELIKTYHNSLVFANGKEGAGSGFIAASGDENFLFTNAHVEAGISGVTFKTMDGTDVPGGAGAVAVGEDVFCIAVPKGGKPFEIMQGVDANAGIGDPVVVIGNAEGGGVVNTIFGKIVGIGPNLVEIDAPFVPGNSGSPIIHLKTGKVIGIATYAVIRKYDVTTNEKMRTPEIRRYGYRLDTVSKWQAVNPQTFGTQASAMREIETLTDDLYDFFRDLSEHKGKVTAGRHTNPVIKTRIDEWLADTNRRQSANDAQWASTNFLSFLKVACLADVTAAQRQMTYDYFQRELADQKGYRDEMSKAFEEIIKGIGN
jgi:hypothetical protein